MKKSISLNGKNSKSNCTHQHISTPVIDDVLYEPMVELMYKILLQTEDAAI